MGDDTLCQGREIGMPACLAGLRRSNFDLSAAYSLPFFNRWEVASHRITRYWGSSNTLLLVSHLGLWPLQIVAGTNAILVTLTKCPPSDAKMPHLHRSPPPARSSRRSSGKTQLCRLYQQPRRHRKPPLPRRRKTKRRLDGVFSRARANEKLLSSLLPNKFV